MAPEPSKLFELADLIKVTGGLAGILSLIWIAHNIGYARARNAEGLSNLKRRFEEVYAPIISVLMSRHVSSAQAIFSIPWKNRPRAFWESLKIGQYSLALSALKGKRYSKMSVGVDFGQDFPFKEIKTIVSEHIVSSDPKLVILVANVDRSYNEPSEENLELMNYEEQKLYEHIWNGYNRLAKLFASNY